MATIIIYNTRIVTPDGIINGWIEIDGRLITRVETGIWDGETDPDALIIDAAGRLLMPGVIDEHVHFREPGMTSKATIASESRAAVAGGVTSFIDMPNVIPPTVSVDLINRKKAIAARDSVANYGFYIGATADNLNVLPTLDYTGIAGVKLFIGATTGSLVLDEDEDLETLFRTVKVPIAVHAEDNGIIDDNRRRLLEMHDKSGSGDLPVRIHPQLRSREACVKATRRAIELAEAHGSRLHIMHLSTADEVEMLKSLDRSKITAETCPQYLLFDDRRYDDLGTRIKCNPAIKTEADRDVLIQAVKDGVIDTIATDHAPHLLSDKEGGALKAASGMPMIQFMLPLMLDIFPAETVARVCSSTPARIFGITGRGEIRPGMMADVVLVSELTTPMPISDSDVVSTCGWTPVNELTTSHRVDLTLVNGSPAYSRMSGLPVAERVEAMPLKFNHNF